MSRKGINNALLYCQHEQMPISLHLALPYTVLPCRKPPEPGKAPAPKARPQWDARGEIWREVGGKGKGGGKTPSPPPFPPTPPPPPAVPRPAAEGVSSNVVWGVITKLVDKL